MNAPASSNLSRRGPIAIRLVLWVLVAALMAYMLWPPEQPEFHWDFHLAGNRTNLYAVLAGRPVDAKAEAESVLVFSRLDALGKWSEPQRHTGDVAQVVAWQEDLVALFTGGGFFFFGPSGLGFQPPPVKDGLVPLAAAAGPRADPAGELVEQELMVLGLTAGPDGKKQAILAGRGLAGWRTPLETVDLNVNWLPEMADVAAAAVHRRSPRGTSAAASGGDHAEFHLVWTEKPVADTPIGEGRQWRWLRFAYCDTVPDSRWQGPFEEKSIQAEGRLCVAPFGERLVMVYEKPADDVGGGQSFAYAQFTPEDHSWHPVGDVRFPDDASSKRRIVHFGFAPFREGHVLAVRYDDGSLSAFAMDAETGQLTPMADPPRLAARTASEEAPDPLMAMWLVTAFLMVMVMLMALQVSRRRAMSRRVAAGGGGAEEAARLMAAQVERLMYVPVLARRIGAVLLDLLLIVLVAHNVFPLLPWEADLLSAGSRLQAVVLFYMVYMGLLVVYHITMESLWRRTLGKMVAGVSVFTVRGRRAAWWRIVLRNLLRPIDLALLGTVGLFFILMTRRHQTLGDLAGGTRVDMMHRPSAEPQDDDQYLA